MSDTLSRVTSPFSRLDFKQWFDRMQPQTLQIATWLLYINGAFLILQFLDTTQEMGYARSASGLGFALAAITAFSHPIGAFLMANGRRLGYFVAVFSALSPFLVRLFLEIEIGYIHKIDIIFGGDLISGAFDIALAALVLHPQSRRHASVWLS